MAGDTAGTSGLQPLLNRLNRHFNTHRFLWLLALVCFLIAWNRGLALLYGLLAMVLAVLAISWLLPWWSLRALDVSRRAEHTAQVGKPLALDYQVTAPSPRYHLIVAETLPCCLENTATEHFLPAVEGRATFSLSYPCELRGAFQLGNVVIGSAWPFGLVERRRPCRTRPHELVVMPRTFPIRHLPTLRSNLDAIDGYNQTARPDIQNEFAGVREYRFGDSLKHIHWSASARHQTLIVREYESHDRPHFLVVLDANAAADIGEAPWSSFEYAVVIAASMIEYALAHQLGLHLYCGGSHPLSLTVPPGARDSRPWLEQLARIRADGRDRYEDAIATARQRFGDTATLVTFRNRSRPADLPLVSSGHLDILFQDESFTYPLKHYSDGWQSRGDNHRQLLIARNSKLRELFAT